MSFMEKIERRFAKGKHASIGLDTDPDEFSKKVEGFLRREFNLPPFGAIGLLTFSFNKMIIDATKDIAACFKLNRAFYDAQGDALQETIAYIREVAPDVPWIWDAKYGDTGNTTQKYAHYAFEVLNADAVTVNPWGGRDDGIDSFLAHEDKMTFVWCLGSNEGASEFQKVPSVVTGGEIKQLLDGPARSVETFLGFEIYEWAEHSLPLYQRVAMRVANHWNTRGNCGVIVGATNLKELAIVRKLVGDMPILIPGIGKQEGDLAATVRAAIYTDLATGKKSFPALISSSRGILYGPETEDFDKAVREIGERAKKLNEDIKAILKQEGVEL